MRIIIQFETPFEHGESFAEIFKATRDHRVNDNLEEGKWYAAILTNPPFDMDWAIDPYGPFQTADEAFKVVVSVRGRE